ncbi:hypothetical protein [Brevundimonas viscosa]|uniref:Uncharacterized protein n=1 Tax=Brevundimonas viscosa TaxID=871741 RepID=A0A1I6SM55_9CAUL|nr:hypothetical protein [Brevundimonas viscosa]SFS78042.1 hypothetical protein SAMN05192570_2572 [Brevundimonas viscosa]
MALHPPLDPPPSRDGPHPAISLLVGFGVIVAGALIVHVVFNALL